MSYDPIAAGCLCNECPLYGKPVVPPEGPLDAQFVLVGEGPGLQEEKKGRPFVGPSGVQLDMMLQEADIDRGRCWITNSTLCRQETPDVVGPKKYDMKTYLAWLRKQNAARKKEARVTKRPYVPLRSPLDCCRPRLLRELNWFEYQAQRRGQPNGAIVFTLGNFATLAVTGKAGIMKLRGSPMPLTYDPAAGSYRA